MTKFLRTAGWAHVSILHNSLGKIEKLENSLENKFYLPTLSVDHKIPQDYEYVSYSYN